MINARQLKIKVFVSSIAVLFLVNNAWSYETPVIHYDVSRETSFLQDSSSASADVCAPLLNSLSLAPSAGSSAEPQRTVGKVAALGMILGARYALAPKDQKISDMLNQDVSAAPPAQIIAAYRQCQKAHVLRTALSEK